MSPARRIPHPWFRLARLASLRVVGVGIAAVGLAACGDGRVSDPFEDSPPEPSGGIAVEVVAAGFDDPVHLVAPPGDPRLFVVERPGQVWVLHDGTPTDTPFLDIRPLVGTGGERGLLSLAFHPDYAANGRFFVSHTDSAGDTRVVEYAVSEDPDRADPGSARNVLEVDQPFGNHNGGKILFGPDGRLYVALGDGGSGGDPLGHGQDPGTLLGALLRIDVDGGTPYTVPPDNPYVGVPGARDELWAIGLRNPWRISFDEVEGVLYVADVGQNRWEEVNAVPAGEGGHNYGWNVMEGESCFQPTDCEPAGLTLPVLTYPIPAEGCAVIGGWVYRGEAIPEVVGHYFYSDWCAGWLRSFRLEGGEAVDRRSWEVGSLGRVESFGKDADGELYLLSSEGGRVLRLIPGE